MKFLLQYETGLFDASTFATAEDAETHAQACKVQKAVIYVVSEYSCIPSLWKHLHFPPLAI